MKWKVMSILIVLLLLVPSIMAVPQTQDNGNNLQEEESEPLEPLVPPGEPQQEWITFKRVIYREYLPECERYFVGFVFLIIKYNWFTKVISDADMLVFTVGTFPYRKAVTSEGYLVNIVNDYRVIFYYSVDFVNIFADPPMINFWFKTAWESGYFEPHSGGWCLPP